MLGAIFNNNVILLQLCTYVFTSIIISFTYICIIKNKKVTSYGITKMLITNGNT